MAHYIKTWNFGSVGPFKTAAEAAAFAAKHQLASDDGCVAIFQLCGPAEVEKVRAKKK